MEHSFHEVRSLMPDRPLTLDYFYEKLERDESIILEFSSGGTWKINYYSFLTGSDRAILIAMPGSYDTITKTYYLKTVNQEDHTKNTLKRILNYHYGLGLPKGLNSYVYDGIKIKKVICNGPATIIFWNDGTKTVVKAQDEIDDEKGILYAALKKLATKKEYNDILRAIDKEDKACKDGFGIPEFSEKKSETKKHPSDQKCPYCGANWNMTIQRAKLLRKHSAISIVCGKCSGLFTVTSEDDKYVCRPFYKLGNE